MEAPIIGGMRLRKGDSQTVRLHRGASLVDFTEKIGVEPVSLVQVLFHLDEVVIVTQSVVNSTLEVLGVELDYNIEVVPPEDENRELLESFDLGFGENAGSEEDLRARPPVVTVIDHVDHGKTKLLNTLRHTNVVTGEAGGIMQAISTCQIEIEIDGEERATTFIDTPGHEAFTAMRTRGAKSTDVAVPAITADNGAMPQAVEVLNHAKAADVPIVVTVNKVGKLTVDPVRVHGQLSKLGLVPEEYGGETQFVDVSAVTYEGPGGLLETIILTADVALDLRASPDMSAQGMVTEAHLDKRCDPVVTVLVHRGTPRIGDSIVASSAHGRVCVLIDDQGRNVTGALPSMPVQVLRLTSIPGTDDNFLVVEDDQMARRIADKREARMRATQQAKASHRKTLGQLFDELQKGEAQELLLILKGDRAGSVGALEDILSQIDVGDEINLRAINRDVGAIVETNVPLTAALKAVIIGFNVCVTVHAAQLTNRENMDIRYHSAIYTAIDEIESVLKDMPEPIFAGEIYGQAGIRETFRSSKFGDITGCMITEGSIKWSQKTRLLRDGVVVTETSIVSLRRKKDDITEVREGFEHGMTLDNYDDIHTGDVTETFEMVERERS